MLRDIMILFRTGICRSSGCTGRCSTYDAWNQRSHSQVCTRRWLLGRHLCLVERPKEAICSSKLHWSCIWTRVTFLSPQALLRCHHRIKSGYTLCQLAFLTDLDLRIVLPEYCTGESWALLSQMPWQRSQPSKGNMHRCLWCMSYSPNTIKLFLMLTI